MAKKESKNIVITNTRPCLIEVAAPPGSKWTGRLSPGENDVPEEDWAHARKNKAVRMYVEKGFLKNGGEGVAVPLSGGIDALDLDEAFRQIARCSSIETLNQWRESSEVSNLKKAIDARIKELRAAKSSGSQSGE